MIIIFILGTIMSCYALFLSIYLFEETIKMHKEFVFKTSCLFLASWTSSVICIYALGVSIKILLGV